MISKQKLLANPFFPSLVEIHQVILYVQKLLSETTRMAADLRVRSGSGSDYNADLLSQEDIAIITPYRKQVEKIREQLEVFELPPIKVTEKEKKSGR